MPGKIDVLRRAFATRIRSAVRDREVRRRGRPLHKSKPDRAGSYKPRPRWPGSRDCHRWQAMMPRARVLGAERQEHSGKGFTGTRHASLDICVRRQTAPGQACHTGTNGAKWQGESPRFHPSGQLSRRVGCRRAARSRRASVRRLETGGTFLVRDDRQRPHFFIRAADAERARALAPLPQPIEKRTFDGAQACLIEVDIPSDVPARQGSSARGRHRNVRG